MTDSPQYREEYSSQIPAVQLLRNLGWEYLPAAEAVRLRGGRLAGVLLEPVLVEWLRANNRIQYKGQEIPFSDGNVAAAVQALKSVVYDGLVRTNEKLYDLLCLPKALKQTIDGDVRSFDLRYIDFEHPERNVFHLVEEFAVERVGRREEREPDREELEARERGETVDASRQNVRRPDIVLFVNGIPLAVIECKRPDLKEPVAEAVSQNVRNQRADEIPHLFQYVQLILAVAANKGGKYGTVATQAKFYAFWKEALPEAEEAALDQLANTQPDDPATDAVFEGRADVVREHFASYGERKITEQDRLLYALCRPERLLELMYRFIVFDAGEKKVARYQQYFCVRNTMERVHQRDEGGARRGGVVWHTQGSGKSLTMVMLAKAIALDQKILNPRIVLVTDRVDLDDQIYGTFHACGLEPVQANSGNHLAELLNSDKAAIITTIIDKFETVIQKKNYVNQDDNIFVLVDESHRTQYGRRHALMRRALPRACYLGFTGTPIMKREKSTVAKFGGMIDVYSITDAVEDGAVLPLLYEGRDVELRVDKDQIDRWFDRVTSNLSDQQKADLKKKFATTGQLHRAEQKVRCVAWDVAMHYRDSWQGTGLKAQLVAPSKDTAIRYKEFLDETGMVTSEVLISGSDDRQDHDEVEGEVTERVQAFWKKMMERHGSEKEYNKNVITAFKHGDAPEIIIVVSKLLTGFDAPRNTVLYLAKPLKEHSLLQAIARVNRLFDGKEFGYILDYVGVLGKLDEALDLYGALESFDEEDIAGALTDVQYEIEKLPQRHSDVWDVFKGVKNRKDQEEFEQSLADEALRDAFYQRLSRFARTLQIALSCAKFQEETPRHRNERYRSDLKFFVNLRASVRQRYAETVDFKEYEKRIQALVDRHVDAGDVQQITPLVSIFDDEAFQAAVDERHTPRSKADLIASQTNRTISERWDDDPAFYRKFSEMLEQVIKEFRAGRMSDAEFLDKVKRVRDTVVNRTDEDIPAPIRSEEVARAFYGLLKENLGDRLPDSSFDEFGVEASQGLEAIIRKRRIVNWTTNDDVIKKMELAMEDFLFVMRDRYGFSLAFDDIDLINSKCLDVARVRLP